MSQAAAACRSSGSRSEAMKVKKGSGGAAGAGAAAPACTEEELRGRRAGISPEDVLGLQKITSGEPRRGPEERGRAGVAPLSGEAGGRLRPPGAERRRNCALSAPRGSLPFAVAGEGGRRRPSFLEGSRCGTPGSGWGEWIRGFWNSRLQDISSRAQKG